MLGTRQATNSENTLDGGIGIVRWIDLRRRYMEFAQPDWGIGGIKSHGAIVQEETERQSRAMCNGECAESTTVAHHCTDP